MLARGNYGLQKPYPARLYLWYFKDEDTEKRVKDETLKKNCVTSVCELSHNFASN